MRLRDAPLRDALAFTAALAGAIACAAPAETAAEPAPLVIPTAPRPPPRRSQLDGRAFPDHVLALTWDDGPDANTLRLAGFLAARHVSATFFVVEEWAANLSEEPGRGPRPYETGFAFIPILGDLVALGHRVANHTANHVLLATASSDVVVFQLGEDQARIDPFLTNELRLFRAPGGAWSEGASAVVEAEPALRGVVGPVRWDIDGKDWEASLYCRSDRPSAECEPAAADASQASHASRVRAEVTARRYVDAVAAAGHGVVLFHDRVGDVGSDYAVRVAMRVVPELEDRGFVFAAPVLEFSPFCARLADPLTVDWVGSLDPGTMVFEDVDGDGRADLCGRGTGGDACARSVERARRDDARPETVFAFSPGWTPTARTHRTAALRGDVNGDGREDECWRVDDGVSCALEAAHGPLGRSTWLAEDRADAAPWLAGTLFIADVNGDGRADMCSLANADVACALAP